MSNMKIDFTSKEKFLIDTVIYICSCEDKKDTIYEIMRNRNVLLSNENIDEILDFHKLLPADLECKYYGIYDKQLDQFKEHWNNYESKIELKNDFEDYIKEVLIDGSAIENGEWDSDDELWELFEYEIRPYEN